MTGPLPLPFRPGRETLAGNQVKPGPPAKAGPAPPAEADGNCGRSGRGSPQVVVVHKAPYG